MNSSKYFSHNIDARNDEKILAVRMALKAEGYAIYFMILEKLAQQPNYKCVKDYNRIAFDLRVSSELVKKVVENFDLFVIEEDCFYSKSLIERLEKRDELTTSRSEAGKKGMTNRWNNNKRITELSSCYSTEKENVSPTPPIKEIKEKGEVETHAPACDTTTPSFSFNDWWNLYDKKEWESQIRECMDRFMSIIPHDILRLKSYTESYISATPKEKRKQPVYFFRDEIWKNDLSTIPGHKTITYLEGETWVNMLKNGVRIAQVLVNTPDGDRYKMVKYDDAVKYKLNIIKEMK